MTDLHGCTAPLAWELLVDYWADDLDASVLGQVEEHLFGCASCSATSERIARIVQAIRSAIPPIIDSETVAVLRARGLVIEENVFWPGQRQVVTFGPGVDLLIHRLQGLDLSRAERVAVSIRAEASGALLFEDPAAPFDRQRGEVLIACQRHFVAYPPDIVFDVRAHEPSGGTSTARFVVPHLFSSADAG